MRVRRLPYINSRNNRQFFDASSLSITFNEEYCQYPNIIQLRTLEGCVWCNNHFRSFLSFFFLLLLLLLLVLIYTFLYKRAVEERITHHVNLMESVRHELEYSSFFLFRTCIHVYFKKSLPDFKRKNDTFITTYMYLYCMVQYLLIR